MGNNILKGISSALFVTVITLLGGILWNTLGYQGVNVTTLVDIGLITSCITAGFRTGKGSRIWFLGGLAALGYVGLCIILAALFLPISGWGAVQILAEGGLIGILAGAFGAGKQGLSIDGIGLKRSASSHPLAFSSSSWDDERHWEERYDDRHEEGYGRNEESDNKKESEWDQWMSKDRDDRDVKINKDKHEDKISQVSEDNWLKGEKRAWWDEETGF